MFQISHLQEEQSQLDQDIEENQSERNQKYRELRKREESMDQFLASYEESKATELERLSELEQSIQVSFPELLWTKGICLLDVHLYSDAD